jgi:uncharacterized protein (TIGR03067 family)
MKQALLFVGVLLCTAAEPVKEEADLKSLQGDWEMLSLEIGEQLVPAEKLKGTTLTVKGEMYTVVTKRTRQEVTFKLDPTQKPKAIDMTFPDGTEAPKVGKGIYKIEGDTWTICRSQSNQGDRPTSFVTSRMNDHFVVVWKKKNP